jgi:hypothetical protein
LLAAVQSARPPRANSAHGSPAIVGESDTDAIVAEAVDYLKSAEPDTGPGTGISR